MKYDVSESESLAIRHKMFISKKCRQALSLALLLYMRRTQETGRGSLWQKYCYCWVFFFVGDGQSFLVLVAFVTIFIARG